MASDSTSAPDDLLESALSTAFTNYPPLVPSASGSTSPPPPQAVATAAPQETPAAPSSSSSSSDESWKEEYEARLAGWRAEAAVAREKAEKERARWESIRREEALSGSSASGWEAIQDAEETVVTPPPAGEPSPADARDLVAGEGQGSGHGRAPLSSVIASNLPRDSAAPPTSAPADDASSRWEEIPSLASSFPSLPSPPSQHRPVPIDKRHDQPQAPQGAPPSATLTVFDSRLSKRTRALALLSSLAINLFLPFVNGVMLGFGEIWAKNVVQWSKNWWNAPGGVGVRAGPPRRRGL